MDGSRGNGDRILKVALAICIALVVGAEGCSSSGAQQGGAGPGRSTVAMPQANGAAATGPASTTGPSTNNGAASAPNQGGLGGPATNKPPATGTGGAPGVAGAAGMGAPGATPTSNGSGSPPTPAPPVGTGTTCLLPGNGNYTEPGPYKVASMEVDLGMIEASQHTGKFTIYSPDPLETSCLHPIVAWGNGTGVQGAGVYTFLNNNAASWGMVVAESEEDNTGSGNFHKAGIDYLLKQNADPSSKFYQKLSTRAATSGHSQGGFGATIGASHPNVVTSVIEGATNVATAKVSVLIMTGTMDIVSGAEMLVTGAKGPMFVADWEGGDHFSTETLAGYISGDKGSLQFTRLYAAWFRCFLADDGVACKLFTGGTPSGCGICKDPGWHALASSNM